MLDPNELSKRIRTKLPGAEVELRDTTGTGDHFEARVVSAAFAGMSMVEQHKLVYGSFDDLLKTGELHALALKTFTPEQWQKMGAMKK